ncbi:MAG: hypothetical protein CML66_12195 [Rhodobacteraceae bacterium]|nr:hypothetical protein [Paracoccaceae bacterium]MAY48109.1 hypothetical protein [Paracoccaceae bacterium]QEW21948.1 Phytochrome-like protein cph1 [Marinibacterium anthonyi]
MRILIVDDSADDRELVRRAIARMAAPVDRVAEARNEAECLAQLDSKGGTDVVLLDYSLPGSDGLSTLRRIVTQNPFVAVVMITGQGSEDIAVEAMRCGAQDYLTKEAISPESLNRSVTNAAERAAMQRKIDEQRKNLETFAHVLVHDLRGPLQTIRGAIEMLAEDLPPDVANDVGEIMGFIGDGAARMEALIVSLRAYTRIDSAPQDFGPVDLGRAMEAVRQSLASDLDAANAVVICDDQLPVVLGDGPQIEQLLQNLVGNGIKYNLTDQPRIHVSAQIDEDRWEIAVSDNGIGIEAAKVVEIFEPFRRLHKSEDFAGTGLGLATCRKIVERHGGSICCESIQGTGSTFLIRLPGAGADALGPEKVSEAG